LLFFTKMRLEYKNMRFVFWLPLLLAWIVVPVVGWFNYMSRWIGHDALYYTIDTIEQLVPLFSCGWTLVMLDKYLIGNIKYLILVYQKGKSCIFEILFNCILLISSMLPTYILLYQLFPSYEIMLGEFLKCASQIVFLNGLVYMVSFFLRDNVYGFIAAVLYYSLFRILRLDMPQYCIFAFSVLYFNNPAVIITVRNTCLAALVFFLLGYLAEKIYRQKRCFVLKA